MSTKETIPDDFVGLPGAELVTRGLRDVEQQIESLEALLVLVAAPRLSSLGLQIPPSHHHSPEHRLYEKLEALCGSGAHSAYNAYIRRIVSFAHALANEKGFR